jgi:hypothetical protein
VGGKVGWRKLAMADEPLLATVTGEHFQPVRLHYKVYDHEGLLRAFRGWHSCSCRRFPRSATGLPLQNIKERVCPDDLTARSGVYNLFVPGKKCVYVAPELVLHYIDAHDYSPPKVFQKAVLACPRMLSRDYLHAVVKNGASWVGRKGTCRA